jgi:hypothetical protein
METTIKQWVIEKIKGKEKLEGLRISLLGLCPLRHYWAVKEGEEFNEETLLVFQRGIILEDFVRQYYRENFPHKVRYQYKIKHPYGIGHADIIFPERKEIIEIKSCDDTAKVPQEHHIMQLQAYIHFLEEQRKEKNNWHGRLVYIKTPSLQIEEFIVNKDENLIIKIIEILEKLSKALLNSEPPYEDAHWNSWECGYVTKRGNIYECPHLRKCEEYFDKTAKTKERIEKIVEWGGVKRLVEVENELKKIRRQERELEEIKESLMEILFLDGANVVEDEQYVVELNIYSQKRLDTEKIKLEYPEIYNNCLKEITMKRIKITNKEV